MKTLKELAENRDYNIRKQRYDNYLIAHISGVQKCFEEKFVPYCGLDNTTIDLIRTQISQHDQSKYSEEEYNAYLDKFYPSDGADKYTINNNFAYAWLHHLRNNPHHPQYWFLRNDTNHKHDRMLDMPYEYIVEMLCDWGSFAYMDSELKPGIKPNSNAHNWYRLHGYEFGFSRNTKQQIEDILSKCIDL